MNIDENRTRIKEHFNNIYSDLIKFNKLKAGDVSPTIFLALENAEETLEDLLIEWLEQLDYQENIRNKEVLTRDKKI